MKYFILSLIVFSCNVFGAEFMLLPIDSSSVHDGDTINTYVSPTRLPPPLNTLSIRVAHVDTPEMPADSYATTGKLGRAKCDKEARLALEAKEAVIRLIGSSVTMKVSNFTWDKYGGRILGDIKINGVDLAMFLLTKGYAVPYEGEKKTTDWCAN